MKIYDITKCLSGSVLGIGVDDRIVNILDTNDRVIECNLLDSISNSSNKGSDGKRLFHKLSAVSSGYKGVDDVEKNWQRFDVCSSEDEAMGKFYAMVKNKYGADWRKEMKEMK